MLTQADLQRGGDWQVKILELNPESVSSQTRIYEKHTLRMALKWESASWIIKRGMTELEVAQLRKLRGGLPKQGEPYSGAQ